MVRLGMNATTESALMPRRSNAATPVGAKLIVTASGAPGLLGSAQSLKSSLQAHNAMPASARIEYNAIFFIVFVL